jgi:membrane-bound inhibitor of C-type lysozyme
LCIYRKDEEIQMRLVPFAFLACAAAALPADLTIHLPDDAAVSRKTVEYQCDAHGTEIGAPRGPFSVEYINAGSNSLVIVPLSGHTVIFSSVIAASGVRYTAQQYTWWDAKGSVTLSAQTTTGEVHSSCHRVDGKN